jgi:hypothetical protein
MKTSKTTVIGLLICLVCLYMMTDVWLKTPLVVFGAYGFPIGVIITLIGLFKKEQN